VGDVAANVLHHLNNKVGTIPVRVQGIEDKCQSTLMGDPYLAANLSEIEQSARAAMNAVRDSLATLRPIHASPITVAGCVHAALDDVGLPSSVNVITEALVDLPAVVGSQRSLVFVFTNLLDNAARAMGGEGQILIEGDATDAWVEVCVTDDGPGIAPELHEQIFEFNNVAGSGHSRVNGKLGFGLWWVKTLLMRIGGSIAVASDGVRGTKFALRLPRADVEDA
jgi:signal transduction histidine kinase